MMFDLILISSVLNDSIKGIIPKERGLHSEVN